MTAVEYILDGLEKALELERELGARTVEFGPEGRELLLGELSRNAASPLARTPAPSVPKAADAAPVRVSEKPGDDRKTCDFAFLHDRALSAGGVEMMAKIVTAMGKTAETAPIVFTGDWPQAKVYVVLGTAALKKWFPGKTAAPGQWITGDRGRQALVTYSPEYILRFGPVTPAVKKIKVEMWNSLKSVRQRLGV